jgi:hypothetical protein
MAVDASGQVLAGLVLLVKQAAGVRVASKPWATPYCGIIYCANLPYRVKLRVNRALSAYLIKRFDYVRIESSTAFKDVLAFQEGGWKISVKNTYILRKNESPLLSHVDPSVRRQIKKGQRNDLRLCESNDPEPFFEMYQECYRRQGIMLDIDRGGFTSFWDVLRGDDRTALCYVEIRGEKLAGMIINRYRQHHYYTLAAFRRKHAEMAAPSLLLYEYLDKSLRPGETFDFIGANHYTPGITRFKSGFNPEESPYLVLEYWGWKYRLIKPLTPVIKRGKRLLHS